MNNVMQACQKTPIRPQSDPNKNVGKHEKGINYGLLTVFSYKFYRIIFTDKGQAFAHSCYTKFIKQYIIFYDRDRNRNL